MRGPLAYAFHSGDMFDDFRVGHCAEFLGLDGAVRASACEVLEVGRLLARKPSAS